MPYKQLTQEQRYTIYRLMKKGFSKSSISVIIDVHRSTVYRELTRNTGQRGYRYKQAQKLTEERRLNSPKHVCFTQSVQELVVFYLKQDWSPEQISCSLKGRKNIHISHERIYQFIWSEKHSGGTLYKHLRYSQKKKRKRYNSKDNRGQIKGRVNIKERPEVVERKERIGDWESDTVIGKNHKGALVTVVERRSKFTKIKYVPQKTAEHVAQALIEMLTSYKDKVLTITNDNGKEFALHSEIARKLEADVYFANPYHSWERGLNENTNGLIRQYFPKGSAFHDINQTDTDFVEDRLNNRPRKSLQFNTPNEVFENNSVALET